jgi:hypothetical protein
VSEPVKYPSTDSIELLQIIVAAKLGLTDPSGGVAKYPSKDSVELLRILAAAYLA